MRGRALIVIFRACPVSSTTHTSQLSLFLGADKKQHKRIAWAATQQLLAAFGLEHRGPETRAFGSLSSTCTHMSSSSSTSTFLPSCCSQCLRHHVHKVVGSLVKHAVGVPGL